MKYFLLNDEKQLSLEAIKALEAASSRYGVECLRHLLAIYKQIKVFQSHEEVCAAKAKPEDSITQEWLLMSSKEFERKLAVLIQRFAIAKELVAEDGSFEAQAIADAPTVPPPRAA